jgi:predicted metal-binding transcription factor (methanogenesis marker protein 9)
MTAGKKKPEEKDTDSPIIIRPLRDDAVEQLAHSPKRYPGLKRQTAEEHIHELQVHQVELAIEE